MQADIRLSGVRLWLSGSVPEAVDAAAREPITAAGYGEFFVHRTGHGIGLEAHEDPYIVAGNDEPLEPGMAFSVEPGIYPGPDGARAADGGADAGHDDLGHDDPGSTTAKKAGACSRWPAAYISVAVVTVMPFSLASGQASGPATRKNTVA